MDQPLRGAFQQLGEALAVSFLPVRQQSSVALIWRNVLWCLFENPQSCQSCEPRTEAVKLFCKAPQAGTAVALMSA
jgi:hypothetical protein